MPFPQGMIPVFGVKLPAIATAAIVGILLNLIFEFIPASSGRTDQAS